jgi:hypothetical protein
MLQYDNPSVYRMANLPTGIVDTWNLESRRAVIWLLTPKVYQMLRRAFGLGKVDVGSVGVNASHRAGTAPKADF